MAPISSHKNQSNVYLRVVFSMVLISLITAFLFHINLMFTLTFFFGILFLAWFLTPAFFYRSKNPYLAGPFFKGQFRGDFTGGSLSEDRIMLNDFPSTVNLENHPTNLTRCVSCGASIEPDDDYCQSCGIKLP